MFAQQTSNDFNTDYWNSGYPQLYTAGTVGTTPAQGHPALPALWWLGFLIALVVIRVAYSRME